MAIKDIIAVIDDRIAKLQFRKQTSADTVARLLKEILSAQDHVDAIAGEIENFEKTKKCLQDLQAGTAKPT